MRSAAGWVVLGVFGAGALTTVAGAKDVIFGGGPPVSTPSVAKGPPSAEVTLLIKNLGDPDYRVREKAGAALEAKADTVLPDLRRALNETKSPEVARRLTVLIRKIDHDRLVSPRRVTLSVKDRKAKDVFAELSKQSGYRIEFQDSGRDEKYSFEFDDVPFWMALDKVTSKGGFGVQAGYDDDAIHVNSYSNSQSPYVAYAGPFRLVAGSINSNRSLQLSGVGPGGVTNRGQENISLNFNIQSEPKNPILGTTNYQAEVVAAVDDAGVSMVPPKQPNNISSYRSGYYNGGYQRHNISGNLNLVRGDRDATSIKTLKAKLGIILLAGMVPEVEIEDPLKKKELKLVGRNVEVDYDGTTEANGQYSVSLTIKKTGPVDPNNIDYNWTNNLWQKLEMIDDKGNRFRTYGPNSQNNNGMSVKMTVMFGPDNRRGQQIKMGKPVKLIVNEWLQVTHEVTFEFKDIPLP